LAGDPAARGDRAWLEGDFNRKGTSAFAGRIGEQVAAPECTVVDDGTLARRRGSLNIDDEGTPTQCTTLIENGVLARLHADRLNARLMGGNRRQRAARVVRAHDAAAHDQHLMRPGPHAPEESSARCSAAFTRVKFRRRAVDITSGKFVSRRARRMPSRTVAWAALKARP